MSSLSFQTQEKFLFVLRVSTRKLRMAFSYILFGSECAKERKGKCYNLPPIFGFFFNNRAFSSSFLCLNLALSEGSKKRAIVLLLRIVFGVSVRRMAAYMFFFGACRVGVGRHQRINQKIRKK